MASLDEALGWRGATLHDADGHRIGVIDEVYLDADSREPEWALVRTGRLGTGRTFVPLRGTTSGADGPVVPFAKDLVDDAPGVDPDGQISKRDEAVLYRHYGFEEG